MDAISLEVLFSGSSAERRDPACGLGMAVASWQAHGTQSSRPPGVTDVLCTYASH